MSNNNLKINNSLQVVSVDQKEDSRWGYIKVYNDSEQTLWLRLQALSGGTAKSGEVAHVSPQTGIFVAIDDTIDGLQLDQWDDDSAAWQAMTLPAEFTPQPAYRRLGVTIGSSGSVTTQLEGRTYVYTSTSATLEVTYTLKGFTGTLAITTDGTSPVSMSVDFSDPQSPPDNPILVNGVPTDATTLKLSGSGTTPAEVQLACMETDSVTLIPNGSSDPSAEPKVVTPSGSSTISVFNSSSDMQANLWFWDSGQQAPRNSPVPKNTTTPIDMSESPTTWFLDFDLEVVNNDTLVVTPDPKIIVKRPPNTLTNPPS